MKPSVRLDALDGSGRSFRFSGRTGEIVARAPEEVLPALHAVEEAVARGLHAAGFASYEAARGLDAAFSTHPPRADLPLVWFALFRERHEGHALSGLDAAGSFEIGSLRPSLEEREHASRVEAIRQRIAAGETYQVNLTFPLRASFEGDPAALYAAICRSQRAGYCALLEGPFGTIVSASPELFFRWTDGELELRPMKGTRPRGRWSDEDDALAAELRASEKERAENLMIVDLLRNDAGRVSEFGSVTVPELFRLERYPTVHQLTSTVRTRTRPGVELTALFRALFPCGSVTGAPKISTMRLITRFEQGPRGAYTGAIGFASPGEAVFSVAIRTLHLPPGTGGIEIGVGSGITFDARPEPEYRECLQKAAFVHRRLPPFELLETMRWSPGEGFHLLDAHLRRLERSARYFGIPCSMAAVRGGLEAAIAGADRALRVRLLVDESGTPRVQAAPLLPVPEPLRARIADDPVDSRDILLFHKTTAREVYETRRRAHPEFEEVLLLNERGELTEFTTGNLLAVLDGTAFTPPIRCGLLPGVERERRLDRGEARECILRPEDLRRAEAVYLVNSVRGRVRVHIEGCTC